MKKKEHQIINGIEMKQCSNCKEWKLLSDFNQSKAKWDNLHHKCRICNSKYSCQYAKDNPEKHNERTKKSHKKRRQEKPEEVREYQRNYRANTLETRQEYARVYNAIKYANDPEFRNKCIIRKATNYAIASGKLIKPEACTLCHEIGPVQAHHVNYTEYDILHPVFVCKTCHADIHYVKDNEDPNDV